MFRFAWEQTLQERGSSITVDGTSSLSIPAKGAPTSNALKDVCRQARYTRAKLCRFHDPCHKKGLQIHSVLVTSNPDYWIPFPTALHAVSVPERTVAVSQTERKHTVLAACEIISMGNLGRVWSSF